LVAVLHLVVVEEPALPAEAEDFPVPQPVVVQVARVVVVVVAAVVPQLVQKTASIRSTLVTMSSDKLALKDFPVEVALLVPVVVVPKALLVVFPVAVVSQVAVPPVAAPLVVEVLRQPELVTELR